MAKNTKKETDPKLDGFPKKWAKVLENDTDFLEKAQQASKADLDKMIVTANEVEVDSQKDMDADADLAAQKEALKESAAQYVEAIKLSKARAIYCVYIKRSLG